jgi:DNA-binding beta-propeller fold protein YncE
LTNNVVALKLSSFIQPCSTWDKDGETIAGDGTQGNLPSQLSKPQQIAVDSSDKLYIYDTGNNRIQIVEYGAVRTWNYLNERLSGNCLFLDDQGTLFIENGNMKSITRWINGSISAKQAKCQPSGCVNMFVDSTTNDIYITEYSNHRVMKCTANGDQIRVAGITNEAGSSANKLNYPRGIFVDEESKDIFVADLKNGRIQKWSPDGREGITVHTLAGPKTLIKDKNNISYVADQNHRILRLKPNEQQAETIAGSPSKIITYHQTTTIQRYRILFVCRWVTRFFFKSSQKSNFVCV